MRELLEDAVSLNVGPIPVLVRLVVLIGLAALGALIGGSKAWVGGRFMVVLAFLYAVIGSTVFCYVGVTQEFDRWVLVFNGGFKPLLPSLCVYLGVAMLVGLAIALLGEMFRYARTGYRRWLGTFLLYFAVFAAVVHTLVLPILLQRYFDAVLGA